MEIFSNGTLIRSPLIEDLPFLLNLRGDSKLLESSNGRPFPNSIDGGEQWLRSMNIGSFPTFCGWTITNSEGVVIGMVYLQRINWVDQTAWFGIWIGKAFQGGGHGRVATTTVCELAESVYGLRQIRLEVSANNHRARRLYESLDFVDEATLQGAIRSSTGDVDLIIMRRKSVQ